jgi:hypothetical protein
MILRNGHRGGPLRPTPQLIMGILVVITGLVLTADNFGWVDADEVLSYWPGVLVAVGLSKMMRGGARSGQVFGGLLVIGGAFLLADRLRVFEVAVWRFWPLAFVAVGGLLIARAMGWFQAGAAPEGGVPGVTPSAGSITASADHTISEFAMWSGVQRRVSTSAFKRGDLTAIMGGIEVDLRQAAAAGGEAVIDVFVMWGGVEITVPPDWSVSNEIVAIMGGAEDTSTGTQASRSRLIVRGFVIMGGVEIKT